MKALAQWAMKGRWQATVVATLCLAIPILFWLGAAIQALVLLRHGLSQGGRVVLWSLLPAVAWAAAGDPTPILISVGTSALAIMLRHTVRLDQTVLVGALFGIIAYFILPILLSDILPQVQQQSEELMAEFLKSDPDFRDEVLPMVAPIVSGGLAALHSLVIILCLLLGRYWQSSLYNPGGFGQEFRQLRMPLAYSLPAIVVSLAAGELEPVLAGVTPVLTVPLVIAGVALFHGLAKQTQTSSGWLVLMYIAFFTFGHYMYTLLIFVALLDSLLDIRTRLKDTAGNA